LDCIFGIDNFRNEIIWQRTSAHSDSKTCGNSHDVIFLYSKAHHFLWVKQFQEYNEDYVKSHYRYKDKDDRFFRTDNLTAMGLSGGGYEYEWQGVTKIWRLPLHRMQELHDKGRIRYTRSGTAELIRYLDEMPGMPLQDIWSDVPPINSQAKERLGYPTQKPVALLERIIKASSNEGDWILDPFCGCGTATVAAEKLKRRWIGIDVTHLAIALQKYRLKDVFNLIDKKDYQVLGQPEDLPSAKQLALDDRYQFQWWACSLIKAMPFGGEFGAKKGKKGSDQGIDGFINFIDEPNGKFKKIIVQIKSGKVKSGDIRDLIGVVQREQSAIGVFITLERPTKEMKEEAVKAGFYFSPGWNQNYPKIQILTIEELLKGQSVQMPPTNLTFKTAPRNEKSSEQKDLNI
jgi:site-specific DNA-methyltransferase (adenine-specific)